MINEPLKISILKDQVGDMLPPDLLYTILGPTASGKTNLAVALSEVLNGEIISVDSRQVYRGMDIGTGKDLNEYGNIPYHLIDIISPGEHYDISRFQVDFAQAYDSIRSRSKTPIAVGGTGFYLHSLFVQQPYIHIKTNPNLREQLLCKQKTELISLLNNYEIPKDLKIDESSHKRLVRAIEILEALKTDGLIKEPPIKTYLPIIFGINPKVELRRNNISRRLKERIQGGLIEEVKELLNVGISHDTLQYYGLEYKYVSLYLQGTLSEANFFTKLETEIHRYAKRQMTFFRKMEKDGIKIHWLDGETTVERLKEVLSKLKKE